MERIFGQEGVGILHISGLISAMSEGGQDLNIKIIRSARKTLALEVQPEDILVRAPLWATDEQIGNFLRQHRTWIEKALARQVQRQKEAEASPRLTAEELHALADQAMTHIPARVKHYAAQLGVTYGRITIRNQKTRWGSCSAKGDLNFNCLLMLAPPEVLDSVVVHELCHRKEMNHSQRFYGEVLRVFPDYWNCHAWLKNHGDALIRRMTG